MRQEEYLKGEIAAIKHCKVRGMCPIGAVCGEGPKEGSSLFPAIMEVERGAMLWSDLRFESRVFIIRRGVFVCMAHSEQEYEVPLSLVGCGIATGMAELYIPREASDFYYLKALLPSEVCSIAAKPLRRALESKPSPYAQTVLSRVVTNLTAAAFVQSKVVTRQSLRDRIVLELLCVSDSIKRSGGDPAVLDITHGDVAMLVASDRVSTTRTLHRIRDEGLIELGYKCIELKSGIWRLDDLVRDSIIPFYAIDSPSK